MPSGKEIAKIAIISLVALMIAKKTPLASYL